jgi:hypothetical protein
LKQLHFQSKCELEEKDLEKSYSPQGRARLIHVSAAGLSKTIARSSTKNKCKAGR